MSDPITAVPRSPDRVQFRPQPWRLILAFVVAAIFVAWIGWRVPAVLVYVVPVFAVVLAVAVFSLPGLILSAEGIEWYAILPRWRFRRVPWDAVLDVRRSLLGVGNGIKLTIEPGRYEPWVWGTPRPGRSMRLEIWPSGLIRGWESWYSIRHFWSQYGRAAGIAPMDSSLVN